jgi:hypothetical protein
MSSKKLVKEVEYAEDADGTPDDEETYDDLLNEENELREIMTVM